MNKVRRFFINASGLALVNILLRCVSVSFNAYIASKIGAESMGLFTLVMSVYGLAVIFSTSGVNLAAVRLTAERTAVLETVKASDREYRRCVRGIIKSCCTYSLLFGITTGAVLFFSSGFIGERLLGDTRTILSLKALAVSLPAISVTTAFSGYFTGIRKVYKNAASVIFEQTMKILITSTALALAVPPMLDKVEYACLAVVGGAAVSEGLSLILSIVMYTFDSKRTSEAAVSETGCGKVPRTTLRDTSAISLPTAVGSYARQGLVTAEHLAIPWGMKKNGASAAQALASYGVLHGMVFPLILFPSAVLGSFAGMLVPELAECKATLNTGRIESIVRKVLSSSLVFALGAAAVFYMFSAELGELVYGNSDVSAQIKIMAPLIPVMYLDTAVDGMLKGLGEQLESMKINIVDATSSLVLVVLLVPHFGIYGYMAVIYICEILNAVLSLRRLIKVTGIKIDLVSAVLMPVTCAVLAVTASRILSFIPLFGLDIRNTPWRISASVVIYLALIFIMPDGRAKFEWWKSILFKQKT